MPPTEEEKAYVELQRCQQEQLLAFNDKERARFAHAEDYQELLRTWLNAKATTDRALAA